MHALARSIAGLLVLPATGVGLGNLNVKLLLEIFIRLWKTEFAENYSIRNFI